MNNLFRTSKFISALVKLVLGAAVVLTGLIGLFFNMRHDVGLILILLGSVVLVFGFKACKKVMRQTCPNCGREFVYKSDVTWSPIGVTRKDSVVTAHIEFVCTCPACHSVRVSNETVRIGNENDPNPYISDAKLEKLAHKAWNK